jgi:hypothetical protein
MNWSVPVATLSIWFAFHLRQLTLQVHGLLEDVIFANVGIMRYMAQTHFSGIDGTQLESARYNLMVQLEMSLILLGICVALPFFCRLGALNG